MRRMRHNVTEHATRSNVCLYGLDLKITCKNFALARSTKTMYLSLLRLDDAAKAHGSHHLLHRLHYALGRLPHATNTADERIRRRQ